MQAFKDKMDFALSFENKDDRTVHTKCYLPTVEIKDYNVMNDGQNFFDQPVKNDLRTYDNIKNTEIGQGHDYTTVCLLNYNYFKDYYKLIAIDLSNNKHLLLIQNQYKKLILEET